jgi:hypothetical protein
VKWLAAVVLVGAATFAGAQAPPLEPIYHGVLQLPVAGRGVRDLETHMGRLQVQHWDFFVSPDSNGIFPDQEPVYVAVDRQTFEVPPGQIRKRRRGRLFIYRARRPLPEFGLRYFRLAERQPGIWAVAFRVRGLDVTPLSGDVDACLAAAVIIGDDDAFSGIKLRERGLDAKTFVVPLPCDPNGSWPWLGQ